MKKIVAFVFLAIATVAFAQVVLEQTTVTRTRSRDLTDVQIIWRDDNTIEMRGTIGVTVRTGTNVDSRRSLATITLSDTNLASALTAVGLPNQNLIRDRFVALFQSAWTNKLGTIVINGSESE